MLYFIAHSMRMDEKASKRIVTSAILELSVAGHLKMEQAIASQQIAVEKIRSRLKGSE